MNFNSTALKFLGFATLAILACPHEASSQLSKFNQIYPSRTNTVSGHHNNFHQTNAVSLSQPQDIIGISSINTNRASVSLSLAANAAKGTLVGGSFSFPSGGTTSTGLATVKTPTLSSVGVLTNPVGAGFTATNAGAGWRYNATYNQGDKPHTATSIGVMGAGEFSSQEGSSSNLNKAFITMSPGGGITASPGVGTGTTVSMQIYSENTTDTVNGRTEYSEAGAAENKFTGFQYLNQANSVNNQAKFDALSGSNNAARSSIYDVQENVGVAGGPVTSGGFDTAGGSVGNAFAITDAAPAPAAAPGNYYTVVTNQAGEDAVGLNVTSLASPGPGYAEQTNTAGGSDSDPITFTNTNSIATGGTGNVANTEMTTCTTAAFDCGGVAAGSKRAPYVKTLSNGSFSAFY